MIWCVEDDASIRDIEVYALRSTGFEAEGFEDGTSFWEALRTRRPELVVLDVMLPGVDGLELLRRMRADSKLSDIPIVMATAKGAEYERIRGLDLGADYYLVKPFHMQELLAVVRVMARKYTDTRTNVYTIADLSVDVSAHTVVRAGRVIELTSREYALLEYMIRNKGVVLSRERIENNLWNYDYEGGTNVVDVYVGYLRKKIDTGFSKKLIHTVWGTGWVLRED
mgnify:CR=1 FL=1